MVFLSHCTFEPLDCHCCSQYPLYRMVGYPMVDYLEGPFVKQLLKQDAIEWDFNWA